MEISWEMSASGVFRGADSLKPIDEGNGWVVITRLSTFSFHSGFRENTFICSAPNPSGRGRPSSAYDRRALSTLSGGLWMTPPSGVSGSEIIAYLWTESSGTKRTPSGSKWTFQGHTIPPGSADPEFWIAMSSDFCHDLWQWFFPRIERSSVRFMYKPALTPPSPNFSKGHHHQSSLPVTYRCSSAPTAGGTAT